MKKITAEGWLFIFILVWQAVNITLKLTAIITGNWWCVFIPFIGFFGTIGLLYTVTMLIPADD